MASKAALLFAAILMVYVSIELSSAGPTTRKPISRLVNNGYKTTRITTNRITTTKRPTLPTRPPVDRAWEEEMERRRQVDSIIKAWNKQQGYGK